MTIDKNFVLPENVRLISMFDLPEQVKAKFEYEENDFVITFSNTRNTSKVIDADSASLLREFSTPKTLVEGIFKYSILNQLNPQEVLESSYMLLAQLRNEGFLIDAEGEMDTMQEQELFHTGDFFSGYEIISKLQVISDTEVYKIKKESFFYVLKILKGSGHNKNLLINYENEVAILRHLNGVFTPFLIENGAYNGHHYMVMEWCEGNVSDVETEKYRNQGNPENIYKMLAVACNILEAYAHIHQQGVIHSDIHPRNILVSDTGKVKIIDFGASRFENAPENIARAGVGFFFEPEYAQSMLRQSLLPPSSFPGEQYGISALLYQLYSGKQYIEFSYEKEVLFKQISEEMPIPFSRYDLEINPEIESAIFKGLSKKPIDRFSSIREYADCFKSIKSRLEQDKATSILERKYSILAFTDVLKTRFGLESKLTDKGLQLEPTCSVNYGAAGIAYMLYRMACLENDPELLALADVWVNRAKDYLRNEDRAFFSREIEITKETVGPISIYHSASGVHLIQALVSKAMGDYGGYGNAVSRFLAEASKPCENLDVTLGQSGILIGCSFLTESVYDNQFLVNEVKNLGNYTQRQIWDILDGYPVIGANDPINYRGIAHGWAGIIYATLLWCHTSGNALPANFYQRVGQLVDLGIDENGYMRWITTNNGQDSWAGWCHGSAGYVFLWTLLFDATQDPYYLMLAEKTARHFLETDKVTVNGSLCCGMSGEAYALLSIYRVTNDIFYLTEAKALAKRIVQDAYSPMMRNNSLYKGDVGTAVLFAELEKPLESGMPLFEVV